MKTNRSFKLMDTKSKNIIGIRKYEPKNEDYLKYLRDKSNKGEISIYCNCSSQLELKISKSKHPYLYPASRGKKHSIECVRHPNFQGTGKYEKAWEYNEEKDEHVVRVEKLIPTQKDHEINAVKMKKDKVYVEYLDNSKKGEATVYGLVTKLNMMAWESIVTGKKGRLPMDRAEVSKHVYGISGNIRLSGKKESLQKIFYDELLRNKKIGDLVVQKDIAFVYMEYKTINSEKIGNKLLDFVVCINSFGKEVGFYIDKEIFYEKLKNEPHSDTYIIAGFAYRESRFHHRKLTLGNYGVVPVSEKGLFVESQNEKDIYDSLWKQNLKFIKPYLPVEEYGNFVPDYILYEENEKPYIGEIFGIHGNEEYEKRKKEKIEIANTKEFQKLYRFGYIEV